MDGVGAENLKYYYKFIIELPGLLLMFFSLTSPFLATIGHQN